MIIPTGSVYCVFQAFKAFKIIDATEMLLTTMDHAIEREARTPTHLPRHAAKGDDATPSWWPFCFLVRRGEFLKIFLRMKELQRYVGCNPKKTFLQMVLHFFPVVGLEYQRVYNDFQSPYQRYEHLKKRAVVAHPRPLPLDQFVFQQQVG